MPEAHNQHREMSSGTGMLGKYQIIREIARSNDIVYEAWDPEMGRRIALKELNFPGAANEKAKQDRLDRFKREARAAGSLAHPNIVTIYDYGEDNGRYYIAMEYLEGQTLRNRVDAEGALQQDEAVRIIAEVLDGLAYAHDKGVIHRDVKPDNIQLLPDGRVKITDFGIARLIFEPNLTVDGQIFGTPSYMSPEQVVGREIDARSDVFSCGTLLYEALSGKKPFAGDSVVAISHAIMHVDPPDPSGVSYPICQILRRSLDKAPDNRYSSAKLMAKELRDAIESLKMDPRLASGPAVQQPSVYGSTYLPPVLNQPPIDPYGQPYGQPYGGGSPTIPNAPQTPFPPGWIDPPKRPLFKPETVQFFQKTLLVILVFGSIVAGTFFLVAYLNRAAGENKARSLDSDQYAAQIQQAENVAPTDINAAITQLEQIENALQSQEQKRRVAILLSSFYVRRGEDSLGVGNMNSAISDFESAIRRDSSNATAHHSLGMALMQQAAKSEDLDTRIEQIAKAADSLAKAFALEVGSLNGAYRIDAADAYLKLGREQKAKGDTGAARISFSLAVGAAPGSAEAKAAQNEIANL